MTGVLVNFATVVVGGLIGSFIRKGVPDRLRAAITNGIALCVLVIGVSGAIGTQNQLLMIICIVVGTLIGEALNIERGIEKLGDGVQRMFSGGNGFAEGFVSATLLFSVGSMAVVGSLDAGIWQQRHAAGQGGAGRRVGADVRFDLRLERRAGGRAADAVSGSDRAAGRVGQAVSRRGCDRRDEGGGQRYDHRAEREHAGAFEGRQAAGGEHAAVDVPANSGAAAGSVDSRAVLTEKEVRNDERSA